MKRLISLILGVVVSVNLLFGQSVDQGKKFFYYERYQSAKESFEKVLAANPNDLNAVYWLGRTLIELKDSVAAKQLYTKSLQQNGNAPIILVGMGEIELMEGKTNEARQRFEVALSLTKNKDVNIINAIGAANINARLGDANYAVEKLMLATQMKDFKSPDTYVLLGDAYRKLIDGGNAVTAYQKALTFDPRMAAAKHKIGKVYLTQKNPEYFLPAFEGATQLDQAYAPSWYELYFYWYYRDINKSAAYFDKFLAVSDPSPNNEYDRISIIYARKLYPEAIAAAQQRITSDGDKADARFYKLIAYSYDDSNDSANAKKYMDLYFAKQKPAECVSKDYSFYAKLLGKFNLYDEAYKNYQSAIDSDTALDVKMDLMKEASELAKKSGDRKAQADWLGKSYLMKKSPSNRDLYDWGFAHYQATNYVTADSIFCGLYQSKYPAEIIGYLWCARSKQGQDDSTNSKGLAVEAYKILAEKARSIDSVRYKSQALSSYFFLVQYYNDVAKDKASAILYINKALEVDPTNADAIRIKEILSKAPAARPAAKPKTGTTKNSAPPPAPVKKK